jgi:undecaprenyl diphosphate synthase
MTGDRPHVAIIMDGNGRWATARGRPRSAGHHAGLKRARQIVEAAVRANVGTLTLYAFSSDNWGRPRREVGTLMALLRRALATESKRCLDNGVRLSIIGRRDRLPGELRSAIRRAEELTANGTALHLRVAIDYSARDTVLAAAELARADDRPLTRDRFTELLGIAASQEAPSPDVDLLIRTGGEQRLSDFLLWECAYAELYLTRRLWPDFAESDFADALSEYRARDRRFGRLPEQAAS